MTRRHTLLLFLVPGTLALVVIGSCTGGKIEPTPVVDAGSDASTCASSGGSVNFSFIATTLDTYCVGAPTSCTHTWLSIRRQTNNEEIVIDRPCLSDCTSCEPIGCPALCAAPTRMQPGGEGRTWDGTYWAMRTCGGTTPATACSDRQCAAPGRYIARMCAYREQSPDAGTLPSICTPTTIPTCTEVAFDWPPTTDANKNVLGTIDGADGTKCCPTSWLLYGCTYSDGGAGSNCHNPAMGCASSSTCGDGCDFAVAGRCGG